MAQLWYQALRLRRLLLVSFHSPGVSETASHCHLANLSRAFIHQHSLYFHFVIISCGNTELYKFHRVNFCLQCCFHCLNLLESDVDRVELFRLTLRFFDDASEFSVTSLYVVFILSSKVMLIFLLYNKSSVVAEIGDRLATIIIGCLLYTSPSPRD